MVGQVNEYPWIAAFDLSGVDGANPGGCAATLVRSHSSQITNNRSQISQITNHKSWRLCCYSGQISLITVHTSQFEQLYYSCQIVLYKLITKRFLSLSTFHFQRLTTGQISTNWAVTASHCFVDPDTGERVSVSSSL